MLKTACKSSRSIRGRHRPAALGTAAKNSGDFLSEMRWLKFALESNPKDVETNKQCARPCRARAVDQAIACCTASRTPARRRRTARAISELTVRKQMSARFEEEKKKKVATPKQAEKQAQADVEQKKAEDEAEEHSLARRSQTQEHGQPLRVGEALRNRGRWPMPKRSTSRPTNSRQRSEVRERWIDVQLQRARAEMLDARNRRKESPRRAGIPPVEQDPQREGNGAGRVPLRAVSQQLAVQVRLGAGLSDDGQARRGDQEFRPRATIRVARGSASWARAVLPGDQAGRLAMHHYELAVQEIPDATRQQETALYLAQDGHGRMKDKKLAEKHLSVLAGFDFSYKDVAELLAKLAEDDIEGEPAPQHRGRRRTPCAVIPHTACAEYTEIQASLFPFPEVSCRISRVREAPAPRHRPPREKPLGEAVLRTQYRKLEAVEARDADKAQANCRPPPRSWTRGQQAHHPPQCRARTNRALGQGQEAQAGGQVATPAR